MEADQRGRGLAMSFQNYFVSTDPSSSALLCLTLHLQGISIRLFPGCENMWWKNCAFLPAEGKQNATFSPNFTQPARSLLEIPCNVPSLRQRRRKGVNLISQNSTPRISLMIMKAMLTRFSDAGAFIWNQGSSLRPALKSSLEGSLCKPLKGCSKW